MTVRTKMMQAKDISAGPIYRFKPQENRLINALLSPDLLQKDLLISKIENTKVELSREPYGLSFWFYDDDEVSLGDMSGELVFMSAYQGDRNPLYANVVLYEGKPKEIYFYTADGSDLVIDDVVLNDVEHYVRPWFVEASNYAVSEFGLDSVNVGRLELQTIGDNLICGSQDEAEKARSLILGCPILTRLDHTISEMPFAIKAEFYLGEDRSNECRAVVMQSVLDDYFTVFVMDDTSVGGKVPRLLDRYPNGELLGEVREYLSHHNIKELAASELDKDVLYWSGNGDAESGVTLFECLFVGFSWC